MRGQAEVIVFVLMFLIGIALFSSATLWGREIFEENMDYTKLEAAERFSLDLDNSITKIIKFGGLREVEYPFEGTIEILYDINAIEVRTPLSIDIQNDWVNISEGMSYIRERKEGNDLVIQLVYPESYYKIEFFTEDSSLASADYILLEKNETVLEPSPKIKIKITFV